MQYFKLRVLIRPWRKEKINLYRSITAPDGVLQKAIICCYLLTVPAKDSVA